MAVGDDETSISLPFGIEDESWMEDRFISGETVITDT